MAGSIRWNLLGLLFLLLAWPCDSIKSSLRHSKSKVLRGLKATKTSSQEPPGPKSSADSTEPAAKLASTADSGTKVAKTRDPPPPPPPPPPEPEPPIPPPEPPVPPEPVPPAKKGRVADYDFQNYFVEQCRTDLVADVINKGDIITQGQYAQFIYDFCRKSERKGDNCSRVNEANGFASLSPDVQLMYVHSFCPRDMDGQVKCLNGINDQGRQYDFEDELLGLCGDLGKLLVKNGWLLPDDLQETQNGNGDGTANADNPVQKQQIETDSFTYTPPMDTYTDRPTESPTQRPTKAPTNVLLFSTEMPTVELDKSSSYVTEPWLQQETDPPGTRAPRPDALDVVEIKTGESDGSVSSSEGVGGQIYTTGKKGMSLEAMVGITLALLVFIFFVVSLSVAVYNGYRPRTYHLRKQCFHAVSRVWYVGGPGGKQKQRKKDRDNGSKTMIESNPSIDSGEIEFNGPLFESWPTVHNETIPPADDVPDDLTDNNLYSDNPGHDLHYSPSLRYSFPPRMEDASWTEEQIVQEESAIDEVKKAINECNWQEVYYLASKMASQGNIDSCDNLASAIVRSSESETYHNARARAQLSPEDAERAAQLDISLAVGDWVNLAARAAVYACLESAKSPVPEQISFGSGQDQEDAPDDEEDYGQVDPEYEEEVIVDETEEEEDDDYGHK